MAKLADAWVRRGGGASDREPEPLPGRPVFVEAIDCRDRFNRLHSPNKPNMQLVITFDVPQGGRDGGGISLFVVEIGPKDFPTILREMSGVDRQAAMKAMAAELLRQIEASDQVDVQPELAPVN